MKYLLTLLCLYLSTLLYGQSCFCKDNPDLQEFISCDTTTFSNGAKLYWQFNCDSSWLTFESPRGRKKELDALYDAGLDLTHKMGLQYIRENKRSFLLMHNLISGCCTPPEFLLYSKGNGELLENLGQLIYYSDEGPSNFVLYFPDDSFNVITLRFIDTGKKYRIALPKDRIRTSLKKTGDPYAEHLFEEGEQKGSLFIIAYRYQKKEGAEKWYTGKVVIDLRKYTP